MVLKFEYLNVVQIYKVFLFWGDAKLHRVILVSYQVIFVWVMIKSIYLEVPKLFNKFENLHSYSYRHIIRALPLLKNACI